MRCRADAKKRKRNRHRKRAHRPLFLFFIDCVGTEARGACRRHAYSRLPLCVCLCRCRVLLFLAGSFALADDKIKRNKKRKHTNARKDHRLHPSARWQEKDRVRTRNTPDAMASLSYLAKTQRPPRTLLLKIAQGKARESTHLGDALFLEKKANLATGTTTPTREHTRTHKSTR